MTPPSTNKAGFVPGQEWPTLYPRSGDRRHGWRARLASMVSYSMEYLRKWPTLHCAGRHWIRSFIYHCTASHVRRPSWTPSAAAAGLPWHGHIMAAACQGRRLQRPPPATAAARHSQRPPRPLPDAVATRHGRRLPWPPPAKAAASHGEKTHGTDACRHTLIMIVNRYKILSVSMYLC